MPPINRAILVPLVLQLAAALDIDPLTLALAQGIIPSLTSLALTSGNTANETFSLASVDVTGDIIAYSSNPAVATVASAPDQPTVGAGTGGTNSTLAIPVTGTGPFGGVPTTVALEVDENGTNTWARQTAVAWTGSQTATQSVTATGLTSSKNYAGKIRAVTINATGESYASSPITSGSTTSTPVYTSPLSSSPILRHGTDWQSMTSAAAQSKWYDKSYDVTKQTIDTVTTFRGGQTTQLPISDATNTYQNKYVSYRDDTGNYQRAIARTILKFTGCSAADLQTYDTSGNALINFLYGTKFWVWPTSGGGLKWDVIVNGHEQLGSAAGINLHDGNWHELVLMAQAEASPSTLIDYKIVHGVDDGTGHFTRTTLASFTLDAGATAPSAFYFNLITPVVAAGTTRSINLAMVEFDSGNTDGSTGTTGTLTPLTSIGN